MPEAAPISALWARRAVALVFGINGFVYANIVSRLPLVQDRYGLDHGGLGMVLLAHSLGAIAAMPFTGWVIGRLGSSRVVWWTGSVFCLLAPLIAFFDRPLVLVALFLLMGVAAGMLDVSMNAQAVLVERALQRPVMSSFHALFSLGMVAGAGAGALFAWLERSLAQQLLVMMVLGLACVWWAWHHFLPEEQTEGQAAGPLVRLPDRAMLAIGLIAFCCMSGEGAMADWTTNYLVREVGASAAIAPFGLAAFSAAMTGGRLLGDRARRRYGDARLLRWCSAMATAGLALGLAWLWTPTALAGFFLVGLGLSVIVPIAYSRAGHAPGYPPGAGIAMVTTIGYAGFLLGPPVIGFLADLHSLRLALSVVLLLFLLMGWLSWRQPREQTTA